MRRANTGNNQIRPKNQMALRVENAGGRKSKKKERDQHSKIAEHIIFVYK